LDFIDADGVDLTERAVFRPQATTCSTASHTLSQEVRKYSAVSFQERLQVQSRGISGPSTVLASHRVSGAPQTCRTGPRLLFSQCRHGINVCSSARWKGDGDRCHGHE
jgi:hypothetical protein